MKMEAMTATFGKLEGQTLNLRPGLNVIPAPNEWGKSTWCSFLLAMLYRVDTRAKTTKDGFVHHILNFLQKQGLIEYIEADEMIKTTKKLDQFMDYNLLNKNNFNRVLQVLGVMADE